jgi:murein DD-endopeptidase MepM/ murein hydrolase activator NlpD
MTRERVRSVWDSRLILLAVTLTLLASGCAGILPQPTAAPAGPTTHLTASDDDDFSQLIAQLRSDLNRYNSREVAQKPSLTPQTQTTKARDREFANRANALFAPLNGTAMHMPVVGVKARDLDDSWHAPRDGGARLHTGIDIFASKGTPVVAVEDGIISYIGDQPKGGHCLWLTTESGTSFYYAHLDRWAPGMYEGMEVQTGDLLGFVGNTGNAIHTPSHLHFAIAQNDEMVNPYPILTRALPVMQARMHVQLGGGSFGTR